MSLDLSNFPQPEVIETLDYNKIYAEEVEDFKARWEIVREKYPELPPYNVEMLETDPASILLGVDAYRDLMLRGRINSAAKANLVAFATGSDLDHLAAFYGVVRMTGETDDSFRDRLLIEIKGRSTGGSSYWYAAAARRADVRIKSVVVYRERVLPVIHIAVLSSENGGIPDQAMLDAVKAIVTSDQVRLVNDTIIVEAAVSSPTDIEADIWLLPNTTSAVIEALPGNLREAWANESGVGFDLEPSWVEARLHVPGVKRVRVITPADTVVADSGVAIALGEIKLNFKGYDY
ncbi:baseplate assembly protein [Pseudochrobactrum asaccharolyticum]|uniref:Phage-related baseplate assembly protein n=1 Tax=Pseudochrobactrum asaccharolyticum TaxID=354351 RepID=A0A366DKQ5_9HYPH|nr:baseplate J/gp47 family protein [Pseudochrobactrum asaccharolyticum]RBO90515.1 phage-related baseplate assembly protein [Pseudochrobactrum asaccharolyticum]